MSLSAPNREGPQKVRHRRSMASTLVEPFKQIKLGLYVFAISIAFVGLASFMFWFAFSQQYQQVMNIFKVIDPTLKWELVTNDVFLANALRLGALFVAFIAVLFSVVFRMTHRIYGPLVSIERFVEQMAHGQYDKRVTIRQGDDLLRLVGRLNHMVEALEKRHGKLPNIAPELLISDEFDPTEEQAS